MALAGIEGQENISDDIIIHGKDQEEHDLQLEKVIVRIKERGLTLVSETPKFSWACKLLWPFDTQLGDHHLTKSGTPLVFGGEQKKAFQELKEQLARVETLGYFHEDAPTQVIADASPVDGERC